MNFMVVLLVCATSIAPADCTEHTAVDVVPYGVASELGCAMNWQQVIAKGSLREGIGENLYVKTLCTRRGAPSDQNAER